jgi:dinuclear metal center YbgI/SA1388 family protein
MSATVADLAAAFEQIAHPRLAESWDNVGLLAGDPAAPLTRVLVTIDYTPAVAAEARAARCDAVVAYHPPIFQAKKRILPGDGVFEAIRDGIALYSPHTALDVAPGGTNDVLCDLVGARDRAPLRLNPALDGLGIGRLATVDPIDRGALVARVKEGLSVDGLLVAGPLAGDVTRVAVCAGAGGELLGDALRARAQVFLTGELRHHDALRAAAAGVTVICALHSNSERVTLRHLVARLAGALPTVAFVLSTADRDPFSLRLPAAPRPPPEPQPRDHEGRQPAATGADPPHRAAAADPDVSRGQRRSGLARLSVIV